MIHLFPMSIKVHVFIGPYIEISVSKSFFWEKVDLCKEPINESLYRLDSENSTNIKEIRLGSNLQNTFGISWAENHTDCMAFEIPDEEKSLELFRDTFKIQIEYLEKILGKDKISLKFGGMIYYW